MALRRFTTHHAGNSFFVGRQGTAVGSRPARTADKASRRRRGLLAAVCLSCCLALPATGLGSAASASPVSLTRDGAFLVATWTQPTAGAASVAIETAPGVVPPGPRMNPIPLAPGQVELQALPLAVFSPLLSRGERHALRIRIPARSSPGLRRVRVEVLDIARHTVAVRALALRDIPRAPREGK